MTTSDSRLHNAFLLGAKKEFRRLLALPTGTSSHNGGSSHFGGPSSGPRSWSTNGNVSSLYQPPEKIDVNARDALGRTVLHLIAYSLEPSALEFLRLLLDSNPKNGLQVNAQDVESGWTALHRALYVGNLAAARILLEEERTDTHVKDWEGLTCWDLFNGTVEGTNPPEGATMGDALFTWGANRNFTLGTDGDRALPERITLKRAEKKPCFTASGEGGESDRGDLRRFEGVGVRDVQMSKLHTGVITTERSSNVNFCGFGSGGRLGRNVHAQIDLAPIPDFPQQIVSLALGQDHTLALTSSGYILSWGLNRFATLGYPVDAPPLGSKFQKEPEEAVQVSPKRIVGPLKKEDVKGVAASRCSSACWTESAVWTWGYNNGHLGYDVGASSTQILPRKVAGVSQPVLGLALTDYALACLLDSHEVLVFYRGGSTKVNFPSHPFFAESAIYRPPQFLNKRPKVTKVTSSGITFACLTSLGDVYTFVLPSPSEVEREAAMAGASRDRSGLIKPQRAWALRKRFTAVRDVALGSDGAIILCTQSGHVFVRTRTAKAAGSNPTGWSSSKTSKFLRIPYLQRIIKVSANESGAFAAIRIDATPQAIEVVGNSVGEDLVSLQPHVRRWMDGRKGTYLLGPDEARLGEDADEDGEVESTAVRLDVKVAHQLLQITDLWKIAEESSSLAGVAGSNCILHAAGRDTPAHLAVVAARSPVLCRLASGDQQGSSAGPIAVERSPEGLVRFILPPVEHITVLLLMHYLYTDDIPSVWDSRIGTRLQELSASGRRLNVMAVRSELRVLADALELSSLADALQYHTKTCVPPSLASDLSRAFQTTQTLLPSSASSPSLSSFALRPDVILELADKQIGCHEAVLRSRSDFFSALFEDDDWTCTRRDFAGVLVVNMQHRKASEMQLVFRFLYEGSGTELFDYHHQETIDQFLDFVFDVLAAARELLLDRLVLVCSTVILRHTTIYNVCSLLDSAGFYNAYALRDSLQHYIAQNMETMLESHLLDSMPSDTLAELTEYVIGRQGHRLPVSRSGILVSAAMDRQRDWLALQDIPKPTIRPHRPPITRSPVLVAADSSAAVSPHFDRRLSTPRPALLSPLASPAMRPLAGGPELDGMFAMDEDVELAAAVAVSLSIGESATLPGVGAEPAASLLSPPASSSSSSKPVWKSRAVEAEKTDLRSIMAESANRRAPQSPARPSTDPSPSLSFKLSQKDRKKMSATALSTSPGSSSPSSRPTEGSSSGPSTPWRLPATAGAAARPSPFSPSTPPTTTSPPPSSLPRSQPTFPLLARSGSSTGLPALSPRPGAAPATPSSMLPLTRPLASNASGEVIRPSRMSSSGGGGGIGSNFSGYNVPSTSRRTSSDVAWATPTFTAPPPTTALPPPQATSSFAHIQQQQRDAVAAAVVIPKTLMEIQAEEEAKAVALQEELDFLKWWEEEEKRMVNASGAGPSVAGGGPGGGRGGKKGGSRGGGGRKAERGKKSKTLPAAATIASDAPAGADAAAVSTTIRGRGGSSQRGQGGGGRGGRHSGGGGRAPMPPREPLAAGQS